MKPPSGSNPEHLIRHYKDGLRGVRLSNVGFASPVYSSDELSANLRGLEERARLEEIERRDRTTADTEYGAPYDDSAEVLEFDAQHRAARAEVIRRLNAGVTRALDDVGRRKWPGGFFRSRYVIQAPNPQDPTGPSSRPTWRVSGREDREAEFSVSLVFSEYEPAVAVGFDVCGLRVDEADPSRLPGAFDLLEEQAREADKAQQRQAAILQVRERNVSKIQLADRLCNTVYPLLRARAVALWGEGNFEYGSQKRIVSGRVEGPLEYDGSEPFVWYARTKAEPRGEIEVTLEFENGRPQLELALKLAGTTVCAGRADVSESSLRSALRELRS